LENFWQQAPAMDRKRILAFSIGLVALTVLVYYRVCGYDFISLHDKLDSSYIFGGLSETNFWWLFHSHSGLWIPLTWLSYMAESEIFGENAGGYHLTNLILHVINVLLVFSVFTKATGNANRSAFVAALFAVHPLHIESVAWITERKDVLSIFFGLLSMGCYLSYVQHEGRRTSYFASVAWMACSLMAKQTLVSLPIILLLLDYWPLGRLDRNTIRPLCVLKIPYILVSALFCPIAIVSQGSRGLETISTYPIWVRIANANLSYVSYLRKAFWPTGLSVFYGHPGENTSLASAAAATGLLLAIMAFVFANWKRRPYLMVGWIWFIVALLPMIGLLQNGKQAMADRFVYFPLLGIDLAVSWFVAEWSIATLPRARRYLLPTASMLIIAILSTLSFIQVGYWRDSASLYERSLAADDNPIMRRMLGARPKRKSRRGLGSSATGGRNGAARCRRCFRSFVRPQRSGPSGRGTRTVPPGDGARRAERRGLLPLGFHLPLSVALRRRETVLRAGARNRPRRSIGAKGSGIAPKAGAGNAESFGKLRLVAGCLQALAPNRRFCQCPMTNAE